MAKRTDAEITAPDSSGGDILVARFSALGDVAMTLPPIYDACLSNPGRRFVMLTRRHPASMFINPPANLTLHPIDTADYKGVAGMRRLYRELKERYDIRAFADLHDVLRTKILRIFFRSGGVKTAKVDKGRGARRRLTRALNKHLVELRPMGLRYADTLREAGAAGRGLFRSIFPELPDPGAFAKASPPKLDGERWICVAPFAAHAGKIYPAQLMQEAISRILDSDDTKVFVFGFGEKESAVIEEWRGRLASTRKEAGRRLVNMAELSIGLPAELALIAHSDCMVSMDSANMHLAVLAGTRVVSVWGATHPYCGFRPAAVADDDMIQLDMVCRPCSVFGNRKCRFGDYRCLNAIAPRRIADRALNLK